MHIISVIVPAYNVEKYIVRTVKSVLNQTFKNIEVIVINDGSNDNTLEKVKELADQDKRVVIIDKKNEGVSIARNDGIKRAKGEYIYFLDGDDWIEEFALANMYERVISQDLDMIVADYYSDYGNNKKEYVYDLRLEAKEVLTGEEYAKKFLNWEIQRCIWNKLYKKNLLINNDIWFPEGVRIGEDVITILRIGMVCKKIGKINNAYLHYMQNTGGVTKGNRAHLKNEYFKIYDILNEFLIKNGKKKEYDDLIYRHKLIDFKDYMFQDYDWNNPEYIKAVDKFLEVVKDKRIKDNEDVIFGRLKLFWIPLRILPNKFMFRMLTYSVRILLKISKVMRGKK